MLPTNNPYGIPSLPGRPANPTGLFRMGMENGGDAPPIGGMPGMGGGDLDQFMQSLDPRQRALIQALTSLPGGPRAGNPPQQQPQPQRAPQPSPMVGGGGGSVPQMPDKAPTNPAAAVVNGFAAGAGQQQQQGGQSWLQRMMQPPASPQAQNWYNNWEANARPGTPESLAADDWYKRFQAQARPGV